MKKILGISAYYHDSAAVILCDGEIIAAAQEERFTRDKHTAKFPTKSIEYCLEETGYTLNELDAIVFYDKPLLKFERLLETYYAFSPRGLISFLKSIDESSSLTIIGRLSLSLNIGKIIDNSFFII